MFTRPARNVAKAEVSGSSLAERRCRIAATVVGVEDQAGMSGRRRRAGARRGRDCGCRRRRGRDCGCRRRRGRGCDRGRHGRSRRGRGCDRGRRCRRRRRSRVGKCLPAISDAHVEHAHVVRQRAYPSRDAPVRPRKELAAQSPCVAVKVQHLGVETKKGAVRRLVDIGECQRVAVQPLTLRVRLVTRLSVRTRCLRSQAL